MSLSVKADQIGIALMSHFLGAHYGVSFSALSIAREMRLEEIPAEVIRVVSAIEKLSDFEEP
jgi:hypothetical protein